MFKKDDIISSYTTKEAVKDGFLVKIEGAMSSNAGIKFPVYLTRAVYDRYVKVPEELQGQQETGRLWDLLYMFTWEARKTDGNTLLYKFFCQLPKTVKILDNENQVKNSPLMREITLKAVITAQDIDDPSPAIFIMLPHED
ncbi:hypothetical protein SAMN05444280_1753 [Tangfeifania diversioriginum]|uniref:Uncharacterized protein n=1 Tax=Tangfeifania diversioriginum TaxID=1168035 RepID=A0A1M6PV69_9BACT|nr:DUF6573 family protein [Tangfeifania diversioriginum]SHK11839.1 hypothetical protein SAMN05444280_1753 [Tangfeifania diversioriginum]